MLKIDLAIHRLMKAHSRYIKAAPADQRFHIGVCSGLVEAFSIAFALAPTKIIAWIPGLADSLKYEGVR